MDYVLLKNFIRFLEVRFYVLVDIKVVGECYGVVKLFVYCDGIVYVSWFLGKKLFLLIKKLIL